jgi:hypothetical protein
MALDPRDHRAWMRTKREGYWRHAHHDTRRTDRYPLPFIISQKTSSDLQDGLENRSLAYTLIYWGKRRIR